MTRLHSNIFLALLCMFAFCTLAAAQTNNPNNPSWWNKYQYLSSHAAARNAGSTSSLSVGPNVDVSNECGPQSETYITLNPSQTKNLAGGSNEIFRDPMRAYASFDDGSSWQGIDAPLPPPLSGTNDSRFGSDPSLVFDTQGNLFYSYIVVFIGGGKGIDGTELAVAKSSDGGKSFPGATFFSFSSGKDHFNDKPMITADNNASSPFSGSIYVAWDAASGGSGSGGIRVARSNDHGASFSLTRADNPSGPGKSIAAVPFVGPNGELYVAWNDYNAHAITFNSSFDGGQTWGANPVQISSDILGFQDAIPAISFRGALLYPACDSDRTNGPHNGRLICTWMDLSPNGLTTDIYVSHSDNNGATWSQRQSVTDLPGLVDRFYPWISVDQTNGSVNISFYDTRNDTTGARFMTDVYFTQSVDGGSTWQPNTRVTTASSNEHDCNGLFPCPAIDYGNQYGDYEGLVSYGGISHPIWTDSRDNQVQVSGCSSPLMEEVFTATVQ